MSTITGEPAMQQQSQPDPMPVGGPAKPARPKRRSRPPAAAGRVADKASGKGDRELLEALLSSKLFQEYEHAFAEATGLPIALRPVDSWQLPLHGKQNEGPFCALMAERSRACGSCLEVQEKLARAANGEPATSVCPAGMSDTVVPVRLGDRLIGFLQTGQVFRKPPTQQQFERTVQLLAKWGVAMDRAVLRHAYFATRVVPSKRHEAVIKLLSIFAQHLSALSNQILVQQENAEPPLITSAKAFITEHQTENLSLGDVSKAINSSPFYFCKLFKKVTGINFTDYLSRIRVERAKNLLLNPNLRVIEIAFEVGFQSLTHFNRVFKHTVGQSPTRYREQLLGGVGPDASRSLARSH